MNDLQKEIKKKKSSNNSKKKFTSLCNEVHCRPQQET